MSIAATTPSTVSATYDRWAFTLATVGDGLADPGAPAARPVECHVNLVKYRVRPDGVSERSPLETDRARLYVPDLYALAATSPAVAQALQALVAAVGSIAQAEGVV